MPDARDSGTTREDGSVMDIYDHWTVAEHFALGVRTVFKPGEYRPKNVTHVPGEYEMTDLVPAEQLRGAVEEAADEHKREAYRLRALMTEAAKLDPVTCRKWIRDALATPAGGQ